MAETFSSKELAFTNVSSTNGFSQMFFNALVNLSELDYDAASTQLVREYFEESLRESVLESVREQCLVLLDRKVELEAAAMGPPMDYCTILDGILDESLEHLELSTPPPTRESFTKLMWVIASRCPQLKTLSITFFNKNLGVKLAVTPEPILNPRLENLHTLGLCSEDRDRGVVLPCLESVLGIIGQTCPKLEVLDMSDFCNLEKRSILALLMGEDLARALFPLEGQLWAKHLNKLRIPTKYLSPICFTLKELNVLDIPHYGAEYAFALRHLPKLSHWHENSSSQIPDHLIKALFKADQEEELNSELQAAFEEQCRLFALALNLNVLESSEKFSGPLSVTMMADISVRDFDALEAVGLMCPQLRYICFEDGNPADPADSYSLHKTIFMDSWSQNKLTEIVLRGVHPDLVKIIIERFGGCLKTLELNNCRRINLSDLWQCTQLESLFIRNSTINGDASDPAIRTSGAFLPSLLEVHCCAARFPSWSFWLQSKSGLIKMRD